MPRLPHRPRLSRRPSIRGGGSARVNGASPAGEALVRSTRRTCPWELPTPALPGQVPTVNGTSSPLRPVSPSSRTLRRQHHAMRGHSRRRARRQPPTAPHGRPRMRNANLFLATVRDATVPEAAFDRGPARTRSPGGRRGTSRCDASSAPCHDPAARNRGPVTSTRPATPECDTTTPPSLGAISARPEATITTRTGRAGKPADAGPTPPPPAGWPCCYARSCNDSRG